jgi:hypothetical protein
MSKYPRIHARRQRCRRVVQIRSEAGIDALPSVRKGFNVHDYPWLVAVDRANEPESFYVPLVEIWSLNKSQPEMFNRKRSPSPALDQRGNASWAWRNPA